MKKNNKRRNQRQGLTLAQHVSYRKRKLAIEQAWHRLRFQSLKLPEGWLANVAKPLRFVMNRSGNFKA